MSKSPGPAIREEGLRPLNPRWEWSADEIRRFGYRVVDLMAEHLTNLPEEPVFRPFPSELADQYMHSMAPEAGQDADEILATFQREIEPYPFGNGHPRFYAWVNSPPAVISIFAEALAAAMNPSCAGGNHAAIYLEREVTNWFKQIVGFPPSSMGLLVSGASMAALTGLAVARHAKCGFNMREEGMLGSPAPLMYYRSGEAHGCHQKAVELLGIGAQNLRTVAHDSTMRMVPSALDTAIAQDKEAGRVPVAVIASAGAVNTGAVDPLDKVADICARHGLWLHVDGAYGGPAILTDKYRKQLSALARADSVAFDPHKWLYVPVEAGLVLVRDAELLRSAFSLVPPYLRTPEGVGGLPWFSEYGFQQTRGFRALKVWMALRYHGLSGYRASIDRDIGLAERLAGNLRRSASFEVFEPQSLSIVCFRYAPASIRQNARQVDDLNKVVLEKLQLSGEAFLSSTVIEGKFWMRACIINPRAREEDLDKLIEAIEEIGRSVQDK